ncbi:RNA-directed DNA polymerase from mobile element jockey [Eumeta japonica]|uniref:RNA-directed DNA polymerase from mobile element jockey n=1 Tax=Eumeta variegata TaxID=151549 RepID=A0A4C1TVF9_EUMVA|nr:RNA-directed DNA polymerase from mobile element jockey [Eumeta japonica]
MLSFNLAGVSRDFGRELNIKSVERGARRPYIGYGSFVWNIGVFGACEADGDGMSLWPVIQRALNASLFGSSGRWSVQRFWIIREKYRIWDLSISLVREFLLAPIPPLSEDYYVSPTETVRTILRLSKRKVPGPDEIPTTAIKQLPRRAMVAMTRLFNGILQTDHFPRSWKTERVIAIPKTGKDPRLTSGPDYTAVPHRQTV